ncbi:hypothetical protein JET14_12685 [Martelella lutilitoris]|uniref:Uncharacterized protein n=1 Tax=Martelella lutilitoris TaxID=2583532 RepID=A0A7T7HHF7_9HYPH|nr:hypothetical protein [Martelella lutilitoris]QQM29189.1 hypothetical protein JET14_12685 [Martelella lutilitoris]
MSDAPCDAALLAERLGRSERLSGARLPAAVLALLLAGQAEDSRTAARALDVAHALVLRAVAMLAGPEPLIEITRRDDRTMRTFYRPTRRAREMAGDIG